MKDKILFPTKMKWYTFHPITFTFLKCRGEKSFHTHLLLYAVSSVNFSRNVCRCLCKQIFVFLLYIYICTINGFLLPKIQHSWYVKKQRQQKTDTKGLTVRHCNFFMFKFTAPASDYDTTSKNTVAHSTFEHLEHHNISKIVILPHKSHVSHKYKCMNDGFLINQHADQKKFVRAEHNSM